MSDPFRTFFAAHAIELMDRAQCSRQDKSELVPVARDVVACCRKARQEGLLSLDDVLADLDPHLAGAVLMVVEGWDPEVWSETLVIQMLADGPRGKDLFKGLLVLLGAADIHAGLNPLVVELLMRSLFGKDADLLDPPRAPAEAVEPEVDWSEALDQVLARGVATERGTRLNQGILALDDVGVQSMLRDFDEYDWAYDLGATGDRDAWTKVLRNLSSRTARRLLEAVLAFPRPSEPVREERQERMLRWLAAEGRRDGV